MSVAPVDELGVRGPRRDRRVEIELLGPVPQELHGAGRVRQLVLSLDESERAGPSREDVQPAVLHLVEDSVDQTRAADRLELVLAEPDDSELTLPFEAFPDHRPVPGLEDVERNVFGRQRDEA